MQLESENTRVLQEHIFRTWGGKYKRLETISLLSTHLLTMVIHGAFITTEEISDILFLGTW